jgi:hypothetical protein
MIRADTSSILRCMFACDFFESADPVFTYIQQQRRRLLSRPYAGYLLFFFGESDTEIATWFARNIIALDSLTGSNLAGLVFAHKIRIQAQRVIETPPASRRRNTTSRLTNSEQVSDSMIRPVDHPRHPFDHRLRPEFQIREMVSATGIQAVYPEEEIGAITYGSDEIAARFGVLADMPCIVLLNAVPTGTVEIIKLSDYDPERIIAFLRQLVAEFISGDEYAEFFIIMHSLHRLNVEIREAISTQNQIKNELTKVRKVVFPELWEMYAKDAFLKGEIKQARKAIWELGRLHTEEKQAILPELKTFKGVDVHGGGPIIEKMRAKATELFPNAEAQRHRRDQLIDEQRAEIETRIESIANSISTLEGAQEDLVAQINHVKVPSLQEAFRNIARENKISSKTSAVKRTIYEWMGSFLKPETLFKLGDSIK